MTQDGKRNRLPSYKNQKGNVMADQFDNNKDNDQEQKYEKFCFLCRRPESQAGKMIDLPNNIHICADCMQKSFDTMNTQMSNGNYSDFFFLFFISSDTAFYQERKSARRSAGFVIRR